MEKLLVFVNQYAGFFSRSVLEMPLVEYAREVGFQAEIVPTRHARHLQQLLRERVIGKVPKVAIAGGDGTIHAAAQELACSDVVLGILPQGTANNFATALRLPIDLPSAFRVIAEGEERAVSLGEAEGEYFTEAAGVGLFADALALYRSGRRTKSLLRSLATALRLWIANRPHRITLTVDGERHVEEAAMVTVANTFRLGPAMPLAPTARLTDEHLDVVVLGPLTRGEMLSYFNAVRAQAHTQLPKVRLLKGRMIRIDSPRRLVVHVDDHASRYTPVTLRTVPGALRVMVDRL
jgi:YegS/Rv2252/BmrU family lipid kinase